jgi:hypothetical protein
LLVLHFTSYAYIGGVKGDATWGTLNEKIAVGKTVSVGLQNNGGTWSVTGNTNPDVAGAGINGLNLMITGKQQGFSTVRACSDSVNCLNVSVDVVANASETNANVLGASTLNNGQLISGNKTVYIIYKNTKAGFTSLKAFQDLGYNLSEVTPVDASGIPSSGYSISTANAAHPYGAWIVNKGTIYFVHELGLIPIADFQTFLNNGGSIGTVVKANTYDMQLPMLNLMQANDSRLQ